MLELIGKATSINVRKVLWLLDELGLAYRRRDVGEGMDPVDEAQWRALNPNRLVPVLRDGDFVLWESNAICRYLAARAGRVDLLPAEPHARARVEQWMDWQATGLNDAWRYAFMARVRQSPLHADAHAIERSIASWNQHMAVLDQQLGATGAFVAGDSFTVADVVIGLSVQRWRQSPIARPDLAAVAGYFARLQQRPAFLCHGDNGLP
ncbi:MAG TPA: glutathione S-transferase [Stenotrophomonas sp.]|nr:glutathione S-transferase [Stenotrophomonas sp.]